MAALSNSALQLATQLEVYNAIRVVHSNGR